jgi:hypothetical protein
MRAPPVLDDLSSFSSERPRRAYRLPNLDELSLFSGMQNSDAVSLLTNSTWTSNNRSAASDAGLMANLTPSANHAQLMAELGTPSTNSSESRRMHEIRRQARTTLRVNALLEGTSAHVDYTLDSGGYGVQQSGRPTSMPHYTEPRQIDRFYTPSGYRNLSQDLRSPPTSGSVSPWS